MFIPFIGFVISGSRAYGDIQTESFFQACISFEFGYFLWIFDNVLDRYI